MVVMVGLLTRVRPGNAAVEDRAHVIGMNRLRAAYLELDPDIERYLVTSAHDDDDGIWQTYNHLMGPNPIWQPFASSAAFIMLVNVALTGVFAGLVAAALGDTPARWWGGGGSGRTVTTARRSLVRPPPAPSPPAPGRSAGAAPGWGAARGRGWRLGHPPAPHHPGPCRAGDVLRSSRRLSSQRGEGGSLRAPPE